MLVFAAFVPHPPLLVPSIGKENLAKLEATDKAMRRLEEELYQAKPDSIIVISPHGELVDGAFSLNLATKYLASFEEFGDLVTKFEFSPDVALIHQIKERLEAKMPVQLLSNEKVDHGLSIPLSYLTRHKLLPIVPISHANLDNKTHFDFGYEIKHLVEPQNKRIAVIASGDLSHALSDDAPAGFSENAKEFDGKIVELLKASNAEQIVNLDKELITSAHECGLKSLLILLGIIHNTNWQAEILSYEGPFGVGYLVCNFELNR